MIEVLKEIWHYEKGIERKVYKFDENKKMKLILGDTTYITQISEFQTVEEDWNCDNDIYELYGAYFSIDGRKEFLTPEDIVSIIEEKNLSIIY